jgi:nucleoside-diphosphate-sugar epimerase
MREFAGKAAFVTGGASGIGSALGRAFAAAGANVMLADIEKAALDAAVQSLAGIGPRYVARCVTLPIRPRSMQLPKALSLPSAISILYATMPGSAPAAASKTSRWITGAGFSTSI